MWNDSNLFYLLFQFIIYFFQFCCSIILNYLDLFISESLIPDNIKSIIIKYTILIIIFILLLIYLFDTFKRTTYLKKLIFSSLVLILLILIFYSFLIIFYTFYIDYPIYNNALFALSTNQLVYNIYQILCLLNFHISSPFI